MRSRYAPLGRLKRKRIGGRRQLTEALEIRLCKSRSYVTIARWEHRPMCDRRFFRRNSPHRNNSVNPRCVLEEAIVTSPLLYPENLMFIKQHVNTHRSI